jgi:hypothetical protein
MPAQIVVSPVVKWLLLLDGVLAVLLAVQLATLPSAPAPRSVLFLMALTLDGVAGTMLSRYPRWAVWMGLIGTSMAVVLSALALPTPLRDGDTTATLRFALRIAVSGFVFWRLARAVRALRQQ